MRMGRRAEPPMPTRLPKADITTIRREADPQGGDGLGALLARQVSYVHTVHNIIQRIDHLGGDGRHGQPEHQAADPILPQVGGFWQKLIS